MLLATRPDLSLLVIMGLVVVILWLVNAGMQMHRDIGAGATPAQRRDFIETAAGVSVVMVLTAYLLPSAITSMEQVDSVDSESRILVIDSGETHTVESNEQETWLAVYDNGLLNLNGSMDLEG